MKPPQLKWLLITCFYPTEAWSCKFENKIWNLFLALLQQGQFHFLPNVKFVIIIMLFLKYIFKHILEYNSISSKFVENGHNVCKMTSCGWTMSSSWSMIKASFYVMRWISHWWSGLIYKMENARQWHRAVKDSKIPSGIKSNSMVKNKYSLFACRPIKQNVHCRSKTVHWKTFWRPQKKWNETPPQKKTYPKTNRFANNTYIGYV